MSHFLIAQLKMKDDSWVPDYAAKVHDIVHKHGGKYLTRSANITPIEGGKPDIDMVALLQFPTMDALQAFIEDPAYAPFAKARQQGTDSVFFALDASDAAGTIPYLI